jgi:hypothetical protein
MEMQKKLKKDENPTWILRRNLYGTTYRPIGTVFFRVCTCSMQYPTKTLATST